MKRIFSIFLLLGTLLAGTTTAAAPAPVEPVTGQIQAVDVAGRRIKADGNVYAVGSRATVRIANGPRLDFRELKPGMSVVLTLSAASDGSAVVTAVQVLAH